MSNADPVNLYLRAIKELTEATVSEAFDLVRWRYANSRAWFAYNDLTLVQQNSVKSPDESVRIAGTR